MIIHPKHKNVFIVSGEPLHVEIRQDEKIVRQLKQVPGDKIPDGIAPFFKSSTYIRAIENYKVIDVNENGSETTLAVHSTPQDFKWWLFKSFEGWVNKYSN